MLWPGLLTGTHRRPKVSNKDMCPCRETFGQASVRVGRPCHNAVGRPCHNARVEWVGSPRNGSEITSRFHFSPHLGPLPRYSLRGGGEETKDEAISEPFPIWFRAFEEQVQEVFSMDDHQGHCRLQGTPRFSALPSPWGSGLFLQQVHLISPGFPKGVPPDPFHPIASRESCVLLL